MIVICYTNHALDQFLEGMSKSTTRIVRLGSQSKSIKLQPFALFQYKTAAQEIKNTRAYTESSYFHFYFQMKDARKRLNELMKDINKRIV